MARGFDQTVADDGPVGPKNDWREREAVIPFGMFWIWTQALTTDTVWVLPTAMLGEARGAMVGRLLSNDGPKMS
jgi:hypothetical protein